MLKQKEYKIADTNLANFGTDLEKEVKKAAALSDPEWNKVASSTPTPGLLIWRIEKFTVKAVKKEDYGQFYSGDSYIVLRTYKEADKILHDIHFWLGATTTQDEAGTAAIKTVELDDALDGLPVQTREVEGHESHSFCELFKGKGGIRILEGGIESGFNHVEEKAYRPRLLHIKGKRNIRVLEVEMKRESLNSGDVFILDAGLNLYQMQGTHAGPFEKAHAGKLCRALDDERGGKPEVYTFSEEDENDEHADQFWKLLGGKGPISSKEDGGDDDWEKAGQQKSLWRVNDEGGMTFTKECEGQTPKSKLDSNDVFVLDVGCECFVWIGKGASKEERKQGLQLALDYLKKENRPHWLPISCVLEGGENEVFNAYLD